MELTLEIVKNYRKERLPGYGATEIPMVVDCIDFLLSELEQAEQKTAVLRKPTDIMYNAGINYLKNRDTNWCVNDLFTVMHDAETNFNLGG